MKIVEEIFEKLEGLTIPAIYREKVRTQRTRSFEMAIPERENAAEILFTLLGIELKVGKLRMASPDLATARYLSVFARIGCRDIAIPYDITRISVLADELEVAWQRMLLVHDRTVGNVSPAAFGRSRAAVIRRVRVELAEIGPGAKMPEFRTSTGQSGA